MERHSFRTMKLGEIAVFYAVFKKNFAELCLISGDCGELGISNLTRKSLMKSYLMQKNYKFTAFTISELLWENQQVVKISPQIRVKVVLRMIMTYLLPSILGTFFR